MRALLPFTLLFVAALGGCADTAACPSLPSHATIQQVDGGDLSVRLDSGELAVLHLGAARLLRRDPDGCVPITLGEVSTGSNVAFQVDAWAASSPMQGWPATVVVG